MNEAFFTPRSLSRKFLEWLLILPVKIFITKIFSCVCFSLSRRLFARSPQGFRPFEARPPFSANDNLLLPFLSLNIMTVKQIATVLVFAAVAVVAHPLTTKRADISLSDWNSHNLEVCVQILNSIQVGLTICRGFSHSN